MRDFLCCKLTKCSYLLKMCKMHLQLGLCSQHLSNLLCGCLGELWGRKGGKEKVGDGEMKRKDHRGH